MTNPEKFFRNRTMPETGKPEVEVDKFSGRETSEEREKRLALEKIEQEMSALVAKGEVKKAAALMKTRNEIENLGKD